MKKVENLREPGSKGQGYSAIQDYSTTGSSDYQIIQHCLRLLIFSQGREAPIVISYNFVSFLT